MAMLKIQASCGWVQSLGNGIRDSDNFRKRQFKNAKGVDLADGKMNSERRRWKKPPVVTRSGDGVFAVKKSHLQTKRRLD